MKKEEVRINCDSCNKDISPHLTAYPADYILKVTAENIAQHKEYQVVYAIAIAPPIENDLYFCNLNCMKQWCINWTYSG